MRSKLLITSVVAVFLLTASSTRVTLNQVSSAPAALSASGYAVVVTPSGAVTVAKLQGLSLDFTTTPPTLKSLPQPSGIVVSETVVATAGATWPTPASPCSDLAVTWNGILQAPGASFDYTVASPATSITFNGTIFPQVGDVLQMKCLP